MLDRRALARAYFTKEKLVSHHINSFNEFLRHGMQRVVDEEGIIETNIEDTYVKLGKIRVENPQFKEADGAFQRIFPNEARLRNITYSAPIKLEMTIIQNGVAVGRTQEADIGELPIMVLSEKCNLYGLTPEEMVEHGEDPLDPGGYFIVNGAERVVITLEDLAPNRIFVEYGEQYDEPIEIAKVYSQRFGYRALTTVERNRKSILEVSFPSLPGKINFVTLMRALGLESDEDILKSVSDNPEIIKFVLENLEEAEVETKEQAMAVLGSKVAAGQARDYQEKRANYVLDRYLLPHIGNSEEDRIAKAKYLGRMAEAVLELAIGLRPEDDKDHYANKRLRLAGDLMEDLFRVAFNRLTRDIKYQLERASMRNRELNVSTIVRSDVLTERLIHPLATGNWVGGRTGVSQLLDRNDYISALSHLRRVISPLSRTQSHFEARDLHPTQWGRLCPSETPEGPNCGLVKNFAQMVEISIGSDEEEVIDTLYKLGMEDWRVAL
jgi:DNA-directed RNA polymerase subunit B"